MKTRTFVAAGLLVALLVAAVVSFYASSNPDGLEYVAGETGFLDQQKPSPTSDGPLAGYETRGIDDDRLSGGVAGILGCLLVLPVNGVTTGTINWQTFSHLSFAFRITPDLLVLGLVFAVVIGVLGGLPPSVRAARANVAFSLRAL